MTYGVTTLDDCMGYPPGTNPGNWCVYDMEEDDPPLGDGMLFSVAHWIAECLNHCASCNEFEYNPGPFDVGPDGSWDIEPYAWFRQFDTRDELEGR